MAAVAACTSESSLTGPEGGPITLEYSFQSGDEGWEGGFSDYHQHMEEGMELAFSREPLPDALDPQDYGLMIFGRNSSDDLFMFLKKEVGMANGLAEDEIYDVDMEITFATREGSGCSGIGGAPGESVFMKAGAAAVEPEATLEDGFYGINIHKGQQAAGGPDAVVIGNVANSSADCSGETWEYKTLTLEDFPAQAGPGGELWLVIGTDSGYEGETLLYYSDIRVTLAESALDSLPGKGGK